VGRCAKVWQGTEPDMTDCNVKLKAYETIAELLSGLSNRAWCGSETLASIRKNDWVNQQAIVIYLLHINIARPKYMTLAA
jgi:hypothetical protein